MTMNDKNCARARAWLAEDAGSAPPESVAEHLDACATCAGLRQVYTETVTTYRDETAAMVGSVPAFGPVLEQARRPSPAELWSTVRQWLTAGVPVAAAAALAVFLLGRDVEPPAAPSAAPGVVEVARSAETLAPGVMLSVDVGATRTVADPAVADIELAGGTRAMVEDWSEARAALRLEEGLVRLRVRPRGPGQVLEVRTALATARVVGTDFSVEHHAASGTRVAVHSGRVLVLDAGGEEVALLGAGESVEVGENVPAPAPAPMVASAPEQPAEEDDADGADRATGDLEEADADNDSVAPAPKRRRRAPTPEAVDEPIQPSALYREARALLARRADGEAVALLEKALKQPATSGPRTWALLGDAYRLAGRSRDARDAYGKAMRDGPSNAPRTVLLDLAALLEGPLGLPVEAAGAYERFVESFPGDKRAPKALAALIRLRSKQGSGTVAELLRRRLVERYPRSDEAAEAFVALSDARLRAGATDAAAAFFRGYMKHQSPAVAEAALVGLMKVRLAQDRPETVLDLADQHGARFEKGSRGAEVARLRARAEAKLRR